MKTFMFFVRLCIYFLGGVFLAFIVNVPIMFVFDLGFVYGFVSYCVLFFPCFGFVFCVGEAAFMRD